jgi:hypothetical protein
MRRVVGWGKRGAGEMKDKKLFRNGRTAFGFVVLLAAGLLCAGALGGSGLAFPLGSSGSATETGPTFLALAPTISSDKADYEPGATVTLTGHNWAASEDVHLFVNDDEGRVWSYSTDVVADLSGDFTAQFVLPNTFVANYTATATGSVSGTATTTFTDGNITAHLESGEGVASITVNYADYGGTATTCTGASSPQSQTINSGNQKNLGNNTVLLGTVTTPTSGFTFERWTTGTSSADNGTPLGSLCIPAPGPGNATDIYAHFVKTTTTAVASNSNPSTYGDSVTLTATVTAASGTPTGSVTFKDGGTNITGCIGIVLSGGSATCIRNDLSAATHSITVVYTAGAGFAGSTSPALSQVVNKAHLTVTVDNKSRVYGDANPTFTATLSGFKLGETSSVVSGSASCSSTAIATSSVAGSTYPITCTVGTLSASNYDFTPFVAGALTVTKAHLAVTADAANRLYGDANPSFTATLTGFKNGQNLGTSGVTGAASCGSAANATSGVAGNPYTITCTIGTLAAGNYDFTPFVNGVLTINKAHLTATADNKSRLYGDPDPAFTATLSGFKNGETSASAGVSGAASCTTTAVAISSVAGSTYPINCAVGTLSAANYDFPNFAPGGLTINKNHLTVSADNKSRGYGDANPSPTYSLLGFKNGETSAVVSGSANCTTAATPTSAVSLSPYPINCDTGTLTAANYDFPGSLPGLLTVTQAHLTVTANDANRAYGNPNPAFAASLSGFKNSETLAMSGVSGTASCSSAATGSSSVPGPYAITCTQGTLAAGNYDFTVFVDGNLTITKAHLTVTAVNASRQYGDPNPAFTATLTGFKNSETLASSGVTGLASCTSLADNFSAVPGPYAINCTQGSLTATNYDFTTFAAGQLTLIKAHLTVTATDLTRPYGDGNPAFAFTFSGFKNFDNPLSAGITGTAACSTAALASSPVADSPFSISCTGGSLAAVNYDFTSFVDGQLTITRARLTVTADAKSRLYGEANPSFTATLTGFKLGQTLGTSGVSGSATCTSPAGPTESVAGSPYAITCVQGSLAAANYDFTPFMGGALTINRAHLTVSADNKSREYGDANPTFTYLFMGFKNGETSSVVSGAASCSTTATASSPVSGSPYIISCAQGSLDAANYDFTSFLNGALTITRATLTVTADDQSREYGDANPAFTHETVGFKNGEHESDLTTAPSCVSAATASSLVSGSPYDITCSGGASDNYLFSYVTGHLSITRATLTVTADDQSREYGDANPAFTASYGGFKNSETLGSSGVTGAPSLTTSATQSSNVGSYAIVAALGTLSSGNYSFSFANGSLSITKATLQVTANTSSKIYGDVNPPFTASYAGFKLSQTLASSDVTGSPSLTTTADQNSNVGPYLIVAALGTLSSGNYSFNFHAGTLTILKATLEVTGNDKTREYGAANPSLDATISGFKNSETLATSGVTGSAGCATTATPASSVGGSPYAITCALGTLAAGNYSFHFNNGQLTVTKATLTVMADNKSKTLGAANPAFTVSYSGFRNGENLGTSGLTGSPSLTTTATTSSPIGSYQITAAIGTVAAGNYSFSLVNGILTILYGTNGFLQPINDTAHTQAQMSVFKAGSTVPVKFQLLNSSGAVVQALVVPQWVTPVQVGTTTSPIDESVYSDPPTSGSTYRWDGSQYIYNWQTSKSDVGKIIRIGARLDDGTTMYVNIGLK